MGAIEKMAAEIERMGAGMMGRVAREAKFEVTRELDRTLKAKQTPDGAAWAPRKDRKPLADMSGKVRVTASETEVAVRTVGKDAALHHAGTSRMVARPMIPQDEAPLPRLWELGFDRAVQRTGTFYMRSRG